MSNPFSKEARAQKQFEYGLADLARGRNAQAEMRFKRAEKLGFNLKEGFEKVAQKDLEEVEKKIRAGRKPDTNENDVSGLDKFNQRNPKPGQAPTSVIHTVGSGATPAENGVASPRPADRDPSKVAIVDAKWDDTAGALVFTKADGDEIVIPFSDCPA